MRNLIFVTILSLLFIGCNSDDVVFTELYEIPNGQWPYSDVYAYTFEVTDTSEMYRLLLYLDFSTDYNWENLYTRISTTYPGDSARTNIVSLELASSTGSWYGDCNSRHCELNIPLQENVKFPMPGEYRIAFEQYMRQEVVEGIEAIGLKVIVPGS